MAVEQASVYIDINTRRIYEVPLGADYVMDGEYRVYDSGTNSPVQTFLDVQKDIWSRGVDWWADSHDYADFPLVRSGGAFRGYDVFGGEKYATNDFTLRVDADDWRIVLADYDHECILSGNLNSDNVDGILFDDARLTAIAKPRMSGFDSFQTYKYVSGSGVTEQNENDIAEKARVAILGNEVFP